MPSDPAFVYLASGSPRRRELLAQIGLRWERLDATVDESPAPQEAAVDYVRRLALAKARAGARAMPSDRPAPVIGADTAVVIDGQILGKPVDAADCLRMLRLLSGRTHDVLTAVALCSGAGEAVALSRSQVSFRELSAAEMTAYQASGEPSDKAGGYAIQGRGAAFIRELRGSYSGVMGLPLYELATLLREQGVDVLAGRETR